MPMPAIMPMMAMTISSSMRVKPDSLLELDVFALLLSTKIFWRYNSVVSNLSKYFNSDKQIFVTKFTYYLPSIWGHKVDGFEPSLAFPLLV